MGGGCLPALACLLQCHCHSVCCPHSSAALPTTLAGSRGDESHRGELQESPSSGRGVSVVTELCLLEVLRLTDRFHGTRGNALVLTVSFLSMITPVISLSGSCTNAPWTLEPRTLPLCPSPSCAGKSTVPCESGFDEVVRHLDAMEREAISPKKLKPRWRPGDSCCDRLSCFSSAFTGQGNLCCSVPLPVFLLYSASIPLAEKGLGPLYLFFHLQVRSQEPCSHCRSVAGESLWDLSNISMSLLPITGSDH